jgi:hypothetical protein
VVLKKDLYVTFLPSEGGTGFVSTIRRDIAKSKTAFRKNYGHLKGIAKNFVPQDRWERFMRDYLMESGVVFVGEPGDIQPVPDIPVIDEPGVVTEEKEDEKIPQVLFGFGVKMEPVKPVEEVVLTGEYKCLHCDNEFTKSDVTSRLVPTCNCLDANKQIWRLQHGKPQEGKEK